MIKEIKSDIYIFISCLLHFFILIYLLHVLFILKFEGVFGNRKVSTKMLKYVVFFIYSIDIYDVCVYIGNG